MYKYIIAFSFAILILVTLKSTATPEVTTINPETKMMSLTTEEKRIILDQGTEAPYSGKWLENKEEGLYICRQCGQTLYKSDDKFDSGSGWPSFDDFIPGAVATRPDGRRTEVVCAKCGGHLGHVFTGEKFTPKNVRHCVNSLSLDFVAEKNLGTAVFAGGCFWGVEDAFSRLPGVVNVVSGYTGGQTDRPTYEQVVTGNTGHAEAVQISYDPARVDYETLARLFFEIHDPTQLNRQGPDKGTQYRSAIFYGDEKQKKTAEDLIKILNTKGFDVVTEVSPLNKFYEAEDYHQDYTSRTGRGACHARVKRFEK